MNDYSSTSGAQSRTRKWSFHQALEKSHLKERKASVRSLILDTSVASSNPGSPKLSASNFRNRVQSYPYHGRNVVALVKTQSTDISSESEPEEGIGRVDSYSHLLLSEPEVLEQNDPPKNVHGANKSSALALAKACIGLSRLEVRHMSLVSIKDNCVTVVGAAKTGKTTLIQRLNLFSSSEGFLHPKESPVSFLEVTGNLDLYRNIGTCLIVLVFAMNDEQSWISCQQWLSHYFDKPKDSMNPINSIVLVGNKSDSGRTVQKDQMRQKAGELVETFCLKYLEVSALMNTSTDKLWAIIKQMTSNAEVETEDIHPVESHDFCKSTGRHNRLARKNSASCENITFF